MLIMKQNDRGVSKLFISIICFFVCMTATCCFSTNASAEGSINGNEARVIAVARGSFEYNGETYVAQQSYVDQLIAKFASEGVDLTAEQADAAIAAIYSNVETGVASGYIVKAESPGDDGNDNPPGKDDKDDDDKKDDKKDDDNNLGKDKKDDKQDQPDNKIDEDAQSPTVKENDDENAVLQLNGILKNTGFSYRDAIILIILLGVIISCVLICSVMVIKDTDRQ